MSEKHAITFSIEVKPKPPAPTLDPIVFGWLMCLSILMIGLLLKHWTRKSRPHIHTNGDKLHLDMDQKSKKWGNKRVEKIQETLENE